MFISSRGELNLEALLKREAPEQNQNRTELKSK